MEWLNYKHVEVIDKGGKGSIPNKGVVRITYGEPGNPNDFEDRREIYIVTKRPITQEEIEKINKANQKRKLMGLSR